MSDCWQLVARDGALFPTALDWVLEAAAAARPQAAVSPEGGPHPLAQPPALQALAALLELVKVPNLGPQLRSL